jgi:lysophospholipase L1-like esterase
MEVLVNWFKVFRSLEPFKEIEMKYVRLLLLSTLALINSQCSKAVPEPEQSQYDNRENTMEETQDDQSVAIRYLALGDSYTIGQGVDEEMRWPNQLAEKLRNARFDIGEVNIIATTGWTTQDLLNGIQKKKPDGHDLVSLLIGVNNQYQKLPFSLYETEFVELLNIAVGLAGGRENVFVVSIPDYGVTPFGSANSAAIGKEIDQYNAYAREKCTELEIPFIDITGISRELGNGEGALAADRLHPSGTQYTQWTEIILPEVVDLLKKTE